MDVKDALFDLLGKTDFNVVGIRPGEKLHETLINSEEIRNSWDLQNKFMISNPIRNDDEIIQSYDNQIKKITDIDEYSSKIATHHSKNELIEIIKKSNLLNHKDD